MMMSVYEALPAATIAIDVILIVLVGILMHRLMRDPTRIWQEREERLREIYAALRLLVSQAEGQARTLDEALAKQAQRLRELVDEANAVRAPAEDPGGRRERRGEPTPPPLRMRVAGLRRSGLELEEIARELDVPLADVRLMVAFEQTARDRAQAARAGGQE